VVCLPDWYLQPKVVPHLPCLEEIAGKAILIYLSSQQSKNVVGSSRDLKVWKLYRLAAPNLQIQNDCCIASPDMINGSVTSRCTENISCMIASRTTSAVSFNQMLPMY
jgi:hypothetical protein